MFFDFLSLALNCEIRNNSTQGVSDNTEATSENAKKERTSVTETDLGPVHALLRIVQKYNTDDLYKCDDSILLAFAKNVLCHVHGKSDWDQKMNKTSAKLSDFITISDEAFAMILIENSAEKWLFQATDRSEDKEGRKVPTSKYTEKYGKQGWRDVGIARFTQLCKKCQMWRTTRIDQDESSTDNASTRTTVFSKFESIVKNEYWKSNSDGNPNQRISAMELERLEMDKQLIYKRKCEQAMMNEESLLMMSMGKGLVVSNDYNYNVVPRAPKRSRLDSGNNFSPDDGTSSLGDAHLQSV